MMDNIKEWASAIAYRLADEYADADGDAVIFDTIERLLIENEWAIKNLIGTPVIDEDYFDKL